MPGSLKARACVTGAAQLKAYCDEKGIPWDPCGKVIVATDASEIARLEEIQRRGIANGVPGIRIIGAEELREVEPHVVGVQALFSPATGIVDYVRWPSPTPTTFASSMARCVPATGSRTSAVRAARPGSRPRVARSRPGG